MRSASEATPGYYQTKLVRGGPWVPARVYFDGQVWFVTVDGEPKGSHADPWQIEWMQVAYHYARPIARMEYEYLLARKEWAKQNDPNHPAANPGKSVNISNTKPVF